MLDRILFVAYCHSCDFDSLHKIELHAVQTGNNLSIVAASVCCRCRTIESQIMEKVQVLKSADKRKTYLVPVLAQVHADSVEQAEAAVFDQIRSGCYAVINGQTLEGKE